MSKLRSKLASFAKKASIAEDFGLDNNSAQNQWYSVSPLAILAGPLGNDLLSQPSKQAAIDFVMSTINDLNSKYEGTEGFDRLSEDYVQKLQQRFQQARDAYGVYEMVMNADQSGAGNTTVKTKNYASTSNTLETKTAGVTDTYGPDYANQYGKVTPYHILFKDFGDQIGSMPKDEALQFVTDKLNELQNNFGGDENYSNLSNDAVNKFLNACKQARDGMGILFKIKDFLLASEDNAVIASLDVILNNPKTANKVASVVNTLLKAHYAAVENKRKNNN